MYSGNHRLRAHDPDGFEKSEIRGLREGKKVYVVRCGGLRSITHWKRDGVLEPRRIQYNIIVQMKRRSARSSADVIPR